MTIVSGKILLVRHQDVTWGLPGGLMEPGEEALNIQSREKLKKYIEIGYGNRWFIRTEVEHPDGTETEIRGIVKLKKLKSIYLRIWIGRKVLIIDSREGIKMTDKIRKCFKFILGFYGE